MSSLCISPPFSVSCPVVCLISVLSQLIGVFRSTLLRSGFLYSLPSKVYQNIAIAPKMALDAKLINGDRYRAIITNFFIPELNNHDVQELWFQQDGATCHTARATIDLLKDTFDDHLISRFGPVNWPPRSCDLTPLDYFLWGYVKSLIYADKPQTLDQLEDNIRRIIADIRPQM
ncbi:putative DD41D transposase [Trichonephila clavipes]|nr:putative DD41D transposase [Trichonephila clavipes]